MNINTNKEPAEIRLSQTEIRSIRIVVATLRTVRNFENAELAGKREIAAAELDDLRRRYGPKPPPKKPKPEGEPKL